MKRFDEKVVLITGASSGIGAALAVEFARRGASLGLAARREDRLADVAARIEAMGRTALTLTCDVTRDGDVERAAAVLRERFGRIDCVVANAGFGVGGRFERLTIDDFRRQFETNVFGVLRTIHATLDDLKSSKGALVLLGSVSGHVAAPGTGPYSMSKFAVRALAETLALELRDTGMDVVLLSPGFVASEIRKIDNLGRLHADAKESVPEWLIVPAEKAARQMVDAIGCRRREAVITNHGKVLVGMSRLCPDLLHWAMRLAPERRRAGERKT